jgi:hypothetical protein
MEPTTKEFLQKPLMEVDFISQLGFRHRDILCGFASISPIRNMYSLKDENEWGICVMNQPLKYFFAYSDRCMIEIKNLDDFLNTFKNVTGKSFDEYLNL